MDDCKNNVKMKWYLIYKITLIWNCCNYYQIKVSIKKMKSPHEIIHRNLHCINSAMSSSVTEVTLVIRVLWVPWCRCICRLLYKIRRNFKNCAIRKFQISCRNTSKSMERMTTKRSTHYSGPIPDFVTLRQWALMNR